MIAELGTDVAIYICMSTAMEFRVVDGETGKTKHVVSTLAFAIRLADEENTRLVKLGYAPAFGVMEAEESYGRCFGITEE